MEKQGASVVITHHILDGKQLLYENWLGEIGPLCKSSPGNIDWQIVKPIPNLTFSYTIIARFDTIENLTNWINSPDRAQLIMKARPLLAADDKYDIRSGLDFLFQDAHEVAKTPVRWKQYLVTWSAIYPLSMVIPIILLPVLNYLGITQKFVISFFVSAMIVYIMVYLLMPNYTKIIKKWLYK